MKKTYIHPSMVTVKLQHHCIICTSGVRGISGGDVDYGGESSNKTGGVRTKESSGIWDEEW